MSPETVLQHGLSSVALLGSGQLNLNLIKLVKLSILKWGLVLAPYFHPLCFITAGARSKYLAWTLAQCNNPPENPTARKKEEPASTKHHKLT